MTNNGEKFKSTIWQKTNATDRPTYQWTVDTYVDFSVCYCMIFYPWIGIEIWHAKTCTLCFLNTYGFDIKKIKIEPAFIEYINFFVQIITFMIICPIIAMSKSYGADILK